MNFAIFGFLQPVMDFAYKTLTAFSDFFNYLLVTPIGELLDIFKTDNWFTSTLASLFQSILTLFSNVFGYSSDTPALLFFVSLALPLIFLTWTIRFLNPLVG